MRILHTMIRVGNLEKSIQFYTEVLGMKLLRQKEYPDGEFTLAFVGYGDESDNTVIEMTYNWGTEKYDIGEGFGHIALEVDDLESQIGRLSEAGVTSTKVRPRKEARSTNVLLTSGSVS